MVNYFYIGILLIFSGMLSSYIGLDRFSDWATPMCWWGYILILDAVIYKIRKKSIIKNNFRLFIYHISFSVLFWVVFEIYNFHLKNWRYVGVPVNPVETFLGMVLSFATIMPGLFYTAEIIDIAGIFKKIKFPILNVTHTLSYILIIVGCVGLIAPLMVPENIAWYLFIMVWIGWIFLLEPINYYSNTMSILSDLTEGYAGRLLNLFAAGVVCGFLWEFWNYRAGSKWEYTVPFTSDIKMFEMPILGLLGFLPFALEYFAAYHTSRLIVFKDIPGGKSIGYKMFD